MQTCKSKKLCRPDPKNGPICQKKQRRDRKMGRRERPDDKKLARKWDSSRFRPKEQKRLPQGDLRRSRKTRKIVVPSVPCIPKETQIERETLIKNNWTKKPKSIFVRIPQRRGTPSHHRRDDKSRSNKPPLTKSGTSLRTCWLGTSRKKKVILHGPLPLQACGTCEAPPEAEWKSCATGGQREGRRRPQSSLHRAQRISFSNDGSKIS